MFGLGIPELILILVIGLVLFGPGKLPEIGKALGKCMHDFKDAINGYETTAEAHKDVTVASSLPPKE